MYFKEHQDGINHIKQKCSKLYCHCEILTKSNTEKHTVQNISNIKHANK